MADFAGKLNLDKYGNLPASGASIVAAMVVTTVVAPSLRLTDVPSSETCTSSSLSPLLVKEISLGGGSK